MLPLENSTTSSDVQLRNLQHTKINPSNEGIAATAGGEIPQITLVENTIIR